MTNVTEAADLYGAFCIYMAADASTAVQQMTKHIRADCHESVTDDDIKVLTDAMIDRYENTIE